MALTCFPVNRSPRNATALDRKFSAFSVAPFFLSIFLGLLLSGASRGEVQLPTPKSHYENFDANSLTSEVALGIVAELDPSLQQQIAQLMNAGPPDATKVPRAEALRVLQSINWEKWKPKVLEVFLHQSNVLDLVPPNAREWVPIVHDALLLFLDRVNQDRLLNRLLDLAYLSPNSSRGDRILQFASRTPTFQKIGQILARNTALEPDIQKSLQTLENSIQTTTVADLKHFIQTELGPEVLQKYKMEFDDRILAEASVGAVMRASVQPPGETERQRVVCKVIKPYVAEAIQEETTILDHLTAYFAQHRDFYQLGSVPLDKMFRDIRNSMLEEIQMDREQQNLLRAADYYRSTPRILIPKLYPFSTKRVTVMEFVRGEKISNSFPNSPKQKAVMARRLSDVLTYEAIFSKHPEAMFHGDPHAGNVFHVLADPKDPYRIALLDWGLCGYFQRPQRQELIQLILGIELKDANRLKKHLAALLDGEPPQSQEKIARLDAVVKEVLNQPSKRNNFETLSDLIVRLTREGYLLRFNITLFIKSQVTIAGILTGLDPTLHQDDYLVKRASGLVFREAPKHLLYTVWFPGWNSHSYPSMLSNEDIRDVLFHKIGGWFK